MTISINLRFRQIKFLHNQCLGVWFFSRFVTQMWNYWQVQIALNEAKLSEEKVKSELHRMQEENMRLKKSKEQVSCASSIIPNKLLFEYTSLHVRFIEDLNVTYFIEDTSNTIRQLRKGGNWMLIEKYWGKQTMDIGECRTDIYVQVTKGYCSWG